MTSEDESTAQVPQELGGTAVASAAFAEFEQRIALLEARLEKTELSQESQARELLISEIRQRMIMRRIAVGVVIVSMLLMTGVLAHATHSFFLGPIVVVPQAVAIAMFLGPTVSITTLAVVLLVGAFRRFKDDDMGNIGFASLASEGVRTAVS